MSPAGPPEAAVGPGGAARIDAVQEYRTAIRDSTRLTRLFTILSEPAPLEVLLDRVVLALSELFAADVAVLLPAPGAGQVAPVCAIGLPEDPSLPPFDMEAGGLAAEAARGAAPLVVPRAAAEPRLDAPLRRLDVETAAYLPALGSQEVQGVLVLARCRPLPFARTDVDLLAAMSHRVGLALEHARAEGERRQVEARLRQARKAESLGRMAGAIAHRFNNLLGAAAVRLDVAAADLPAEHPSRAEVGQALEAVREASQVSGLMLAYLGQASRRRELLDLAALVREALAVEASSLPRAVRLASDVPARPLAVRGDAASLRGLLASLVANAWESIAGDGEIAVALSAWPAADVLRLDHRAPGWEPSAAAYACLEVRDTGCGMDAAALQDAFDPFFTTKSPGRGLGLAVALGTARAHGGTMAVESAAGRGSLFRVFLPLQAEAAASEPSSRAARPAPVAGPGLVLVADDEPTMRRALERLLARMGHEVLCAADGVEAVELFRRRQAEVRLVLLDLTMPRLDGWGALAAIRALRPGTPAILASGYEEARVMDGPVPSPPPLFLKKPFTWDELGAAVARATAGGTHQGG